MVPRIVRGKPAEASHMQRILGYVAESLRCPGKKSEKRGVREENLRKISEWNMSDIGLKVVERRDKGRKNSVKWEEGGESSSPKKKRKKEKKKRQ